ncbi:hypothetical protein [Kitasatospora cheerisanensis]|uniref:Integrase n=1 Tax=Kitasatospora cheerisanensis KCTC 2395 TaxID=1348663 RepID=A0A066YX87_9ACTN|nr:hypothetical protein [Kitasatospora cheerisanensis]KDN85857.1 hypothetical protein KCH_25150 [Kitasatospora cheerisanensis KCTC 2395]
MTIDDFTLKQLARRAESATHIYKLTCYRGTDTEIKAKYDDALSAWRTLLDAQLENGHITNEEHRTRITELTS